MTRKKRSVLRDGKRALIELDVPISRKYATEALKILKRCLDAAKKRGVITGDNPAALAEVAPDRERIDEGLSYLAAADVERLLTCRTCAVLTGRAPGDVDMLVKCPHMPFENRVVFAVGTHQAPRQGEIAGMSWERVDWNAHGWTIAQSWEGSTKNGKTRWQAFIPRAERMLRRWWLLNGSPTNGIVFPSRRPGKAIGERKRFVMGCADDACADDIVTAAKRAGIHLTARHVHVIRSDARKLRARGAARAAKRYAHGFDWGWADHPARHVTRLGWWRRIGIRTEVRFHDVRDTAATHLLSGTWGPAWSMEQVSKHLGHSSIGVTEQRYAHLTQDAKRRAAQSIESDPTHAANLPQVVLFEAYRYAKSLAPEAGLEPTTNRLTADRSVRDFSELEGKSSVCGVFENNSAAAAVALLDAIVAGGHGAHEAAEQLAHAVLSDARAVLALKLLSDPRHAHALDRAIELARLALVDAGFARTTRRSG